MVLQAARKSIPTTEGLRNLIAIAPVQLLCVGFASSRRAPNY
uniref:Uncharacterized protein n=1 Tax=Physcomitrium patens TaxID=3218 RepID=A0A7I4CID0_PHYPA